MPSHRLLDSIRKAASVALCAVTLAAFAGPPAQADDKYPSKPIRLIVPYGPGGATDLAARALSSVLPEFIEQGVIVVNVPGAGGSAGFKRVQDSDPDGYTMMMTAIGANVLRPALSPDLPYGYDDLDYIARTQINPNVLIVKADSAYKTFDDFAKALKEKKSGFKYGTAGPGNVTHLGPNMLLGELGLPPETATPVHYDSDRAALLALLQGEVDFMQGNLASVASALQGGSVRGLAITTPERVEGFKDVPTFTEVGYPGVTIVGWRGVAGPKGLPEDVVKAWEAALAKVVETKSWKSLIKKLGDEPGFMPKADYDTFLAKDFSQYKKIAEQLGLRK